MNRPREPRIIDPDTHKPRWVSIAVAADFLCESRRTVAGWLDDGTLPYRKLGEHTRRKIPVEALVSLIQRRAS